MTKSENDGGDAGVLSAFFAKCSRNAFLVVAGFAVFLGTVQALALGSGVAGLALSQALAWVLLLGAAAAGISAAR